MKLFLLAAMLFTLGIWTTCRAADRLVTVAEGNTRFQVAMVARAIAKNDREPIGNSAREVQNIWLAHIQHARTRGKDR